MKRVSSRNRNVLLIAAVLAVIAVVAVLSRFVKPQMFLNDGAVVSNAPAAANMAAAYLVISVNGEIYEPLPLGEEGRYTIANGDERNVIHVTADSVWMEEASCANQDCVEQGVVSLQNKDTRVLQNMIICLPNQVTLWLYTGDEVLSAWAEQMEELQ